MPDDLSELSAEVEARFSRIEARAINSGNITVKNHRHNCKCQKCLESKPTLWDHLLEES